MTKKINALRVCLVSAGVLFAFVFALSVNTNTAHAALVLDPTTTSMLTNTLSATRNLMNTVQADINAGAFSPAQSTAISSILGGIGTILGNISSMISGVTLPSAGYPPAN